MQREGHLGISLLLYAPVAYVLYTNGLTTMVGLGVVGVVLWSLAPDLDLALPIPHRGPTHSFAAAGFAGIVTAALVVSPAVTGDYGSPAFGIESALRSTRAVAAFGFGIGALGVVSHLLGDVITPMGSGPGGPVRNGDTASPSSCQQISGRTWPSRMQAHWY